MPGEARAHAQIELHTRSYCVRLRFVELSGVLCGVNDMRSFCVGKTCSYCAPRTDQSLVAFCCCQPNLGTDVLTFAVAVGPDIEHIGLASESFDVLYNSFTFATRQNLNASVKERRWVAGVPVPISRLKFRGEQTAQHRGHGDAARTPLRKDVVELVVLHISVPLDVVLHNKLAQLNWQIGARLCSGAHGAHFSLSQMLRNRLRDGWLFRNAQHRPHLHGRAVVPFRP